MRLVRHTGVLSLALAAAVLTACGGSPSSTVSPAAQAQAGPQTPRHGDLHDLLPEDLVAAGSLRVGTDASYPPASSFAGDGRTIIGFEPDLIAAVGRVLGIEVELVPLPFDGLLDDVQAGRIDLAMSSMTDTAERQQRADFVNYFSAGTSIVVRRGNPEGILDLGDLCGRRVAVERGTVQIDMVERSQGRCGARPVELLAKPDNAQALLELRTGRADAVLSDYPPAAALANGARSRAYYQLAADTQYEPGPYGIAVAKDRPRLRDAIQGALERIMSSGEYDRILRSWQVEQGGVRQPSINAAAVAR